MTVSMGPRPDRRAATAPGSQDRGGDAFGPQGVALIRELRRIQGVCDSEHDGGSRDPFPIRDHRDAERAANSKSRMRGVGANSRKGIVTRAVRACLARFRSGAGPSPHRAGKPRADQEQAGAKSGQSPRRDHAGQERRSRERSGQWIVAESPSNILDLRMDGLRPSERSVDRKLPKQSPELPRGARRARGHGEPAPGTPERPILLNRVARAGLSLIGSSYGIFVNRAPGPHAAEVHGADLAGRLRRGFDAELRTGLRVLVLGVGVAGGWAVLVPLSAAVMVAGTLVVESNVKKIQHPTGGVVAQILVHDGMHLKEGELVVRLDAVQVRANLQVVTEQLDETRVRIARLIAERDRTDEPKLPPDLVGRTGETNIEQLIASETSLFKARVNARQSQKELLRGHIGQLGDEITGLDAQIKSKAAQLDLIASELQGVQSLYDKQLVPLTRLTALQREAARIDGERGQLVSTIAETRSKITEAELQIVRIDEDLRTEVGKDLRESENKAAELAQRLVAAQDQLNRIDIRAPTSGVVHQLSAHTVGGVIGPGEVIMEVVPDTDDLQVEAKLRPTDIDQVRLGQQAGVRFPAFNQRTTPQLEGVVSYVSADLSHDHQSQTDAGYYTVRVTLSGDEIRRLGSLQLVSGMPTEVFLQTGSRTMMSYLLKPLTDQLQRTFSER
jgi:HlyD family secretion protein